MIHIQYVLCTRYALASSAIIHPCPEERGEGSDGFTRRTSQVGRSVVRSRRRTMSTPTKENDDGMTTGTNTAVAVADVVASTRVKTPSSVRRATAVDVVFKLNV